MRWNARIGLGLLLMVLGGIALAFGEASYAVEEALVDAASLLEPAETSEGIPLAPIAGGFALGGGVILLVIGSRGSRE